LQNYKTKHDILTNLYSQHSSCRSAYNPVCSIPVCWAARPTCEFRTVAAADRHLHWPACFVAVTSTQLLSVLVLISLIFV